MAIPAEWVPLFRGRDVADRALPVGLPAGRVVTAGGVPALWLSDDPAPVGLWPALRVAHPGSGLWPLVLDSSPWWPDQPWAAGELRPGSGSDPGGHLAADLLARWWAQKVARWAEADPSALAPFGRDFPGATTRPARLRSPGPVADWLAEHLVAQGQATPADSTVESAGSTMDGSAESTAGSTVDGWIAMLRQFTATPTPAGLPSLAEPAGRLIEELTRTGELPPQLRELQERLPGRPTFEPDGSPRFDLTPVPPRLGLVAADRAADALAVAGWCGPANHIGDPGEVAAVLRDWADRFEATVVGAGSATLHLSVAAAPTNLDEALAVAAEHVAFCPDNLGQSEYGTLAAYAHDLVGSRYWSFWWD